MIRLVSMCSMLLFGSMSLACDYYVATDGNDTNAGTIEKPFATLEKARDTIRQHRARGLPGGGIMVFGNTCYQISGRAIMCGGGRDNTIENNIEDQDPRFVDEQSLALALRDDSPAYSLPGFQRIPFDQIGPAE